ncbi:hypothetical protein JCM24511_01057 [Saitozyma sp. JCM 24511]|nr:hypothetical protein JCM24511_01057 [Saitozyma sp. JCM 24511]
MDLQQPKPLKVLAIGSPLSELETLKQKITAINAKHGPFDAVVLVGDVFAPGSDGSELDGLSWRSAVFTTAQGLKIACVGGNFDEKLYESGEEDPLAPTMTKKDVHHLASNSLFHPNTSAEADSLASARQSTTAMPSPFLGADLLLFSSPPPSLSLFSQSYPTSGVTLDHPATPLSEVITKARPRYLFWGEGEGFWEREPFGWTGADGQEERWTRAVKLGALGGEAPAGGKKARWFYAFTLPPQTPNTPVPPRPANTTPNPFHLPPTVAPSGIHPGVPGGRKRAALEDQKAAFNGETGVKKMKTEHGAPPENYVCKICSIPGHWIQDCPEKAKQQEHRQPPPGYVCKICQSSEHLIRDCPNKEAADAARRGGGPRPPPPGYVCRACGMQDAHYIRECPVVAEREGERAKRKELGPAECWFCLSNPKVTKHLIVAIGSETYVTLPKGQLIPTLPRHIAQGGAKPLVPGGGHVLIIPIAHHPTLLSIPADDAMSIISELESYKSALRACYASYGAVPVTFEVGRLTGRGGHAHVQIVPVPQDLTSKVADAFRIAGEKQGLDWEVEPERALARVGSTGNYFKVECPDGTKMVHLLKGNFDLQFGRMVLAGLLGLHHRIDWKECGQSEEEEKADAQAFKKALAPFQP